MRILIVHSKYGTGSMSGENRVVEDEARLLREAGHTVESWSPSFSGTSLLQLVRAGINSVWSRSASARITELTKRFRPDILHVHNLFPMLSPAVLRAGMDRAVPTVVTLHNYRLLCLPGTFVRDGRVCEDCAGRSPWRGVVHSCYQESRFASAALGSSLVLHRILGTFEEVGLYLAVSGFLKEKYVAANFPEDRIWVKPNFAWPAPRRERAGDYFLFAGRLTAEKGIDTLLRAWSSDFGRLVIVGDGPEAASLRRLSNGRAEFWGQLSPAVMSESLAKSRAVLVPSFWYEGAPRIVLEAYARGVPVVASGIGSLTEIVRHDVSGLLVEPRDLSAWRGAVELLESNSECQRLGEGAFELWKERYNPDLALKELETAYGVAGKTAAHDGGAP